MTDVLENTICFPTIVYSIKKYEFFSDIYKVATEALAAQTQDLDEIYPVRMSADLAEDVRMRPFCEYVAITALNILKEQGYKVDDKAAFFSGLWCQEHHKHSAMDQHIHHNGVQIVGFYFLDVPDGSSAATFYDPRAGKVQSGITEANMADVTYASNAFHFKPEPGTLVLTNSWLPHSFTRHAGETPFRFIHFNVNLVDNPVAASCQAEAEVI